MRCIDGFFVWQVSMKLKLAQMWDHNGTNMEAIGFMYRTYKVLIALDDNQEMSGVAPCSSSFTTCPRHPVLPYHSACLPQNMVFILRFTFIQASETLAG